jgi:hypothetical protein
MSFVVGARDKNLNEQHFSLLGYDRRLAFSLSLSPPFQATKNLFYMRHLLIPSISQRQARRSIMAMMFFGPLYLLALPFLLAITATWQGWRMKPAYLWRPFTLLSLLVAFAGTLLWPAFGESTLRNFLFGDSLTALQHLDGSWSALGNLLPLLIAYWAVCSAVFTLVLFPHTIFRLIYVFRKAKRD